MKSAVPSVLVLSRPNISDVRGSNPRTSASLDLSVPFKGSKLAEAGFTFELLKTAQQATPEVDELLTGGGTGMCSKGAAKAEDPRATKRRQQRKRTISRCIAYMLRVAI